MILYADFHIHTALSPCADMDMTPNNIINMAKLNRLDVIAITDHNSIENVASCMAVGEKAGLIVIPGMELQTKEEVHVLCIFNTYSSALKFQEFVYAKLPAMKNNERIFGEQLIIDEYDNVIGKNERLLLTSTNISLEEAFDEVKNLGGAFIPAHIDKSANGIISNLGFIPENLDIRTLEYRSLEKVNMFIKSGLIKSTYNFIKSSDAHYLVDILEHQNPMDFTSTDINDIINKLKS
jgi:3',5'-nucleoside bisphosphate phosphatase